MSTALTKKQQKAQAFRSKQKAKKGGKAEVVSEDVPEQDLEEDAEVEQPEPAVAETSKKRKRDEPEDAKKKDVKGKGKAKTAWDEEDADGEVKGKKSKKEVKQRFILFVGNLGYKTTKEEVQAHFAEAAGEKPAVRLLTTKPTKPSEPPKSRGIAFLELPSSTAMQACLKLHHSSISGRRINVELTAGGGGKSDARLEKIKARNERVGGQRERRAEREKEAEGGGEGGEGTQEAAQDNAEQGGKPKRPRRERGEKPAKPVEVVREDGEAVGADGEKVKIRGGRRVKVKAKIDERPKARNAGDFGGQDRRNDRQGGRVQNSGRPQQGGPRGFKPKWEPTGANAVSVG